MGGMENSTFSHSDARFSKRFSFPTSDRDDEDIKCVDLSASLHYETDQIEGPAATVARPCMMTFGAGYLT